MRLYLSLICIFCIIIKNTNSQIKPEHINYSSKTYQRIKSLIFDSVDNDKVSVRDKLKAFKYRMDLTALITRVREGRALMQRVLNDPDLYTIPDVSAMDKYVFRIRTFVQNVEKIRGSYLTDIPSKLFDLVIDYFDVEGIEPNSLEQKHLIELFEKHGVGNMDDKINDAYRKLYPDFKKLMEKFIKTLFGDHRIRVMRMYNAFLDEKDKNIQVQLFYEIIAFEF